LEASELQHTRDHSGSVSRLAPSEPLSVGEITSSGHRARETPVTKMAARSHPAFRPIRKAGTVPMSSALPRMHENGWFDAARVFNDLQRFSRQTEGYGVSGIALPCGTAVAHRRPRTVFARRHAVSIPDHSGAVGERSVCPRPPPASVRAQPPHGRGKQDRRVRRGYRRLPSRSCGRSSNQV
jgi:hypothetical protein